MMLTLAIGFTAQLFFSARILVQWVLSERARRVLSPTVFWVLSLAGSYLLCLYGWLRDDFAIVFGQFLSYYIYLWNVFVKLNEHKSSLLMPWRENKREANLNAKGVWRRVPLLLRWLLLLTPVVALAALMTDGEAVARAFFHNDAIPLWLLLFGSAGQLIFTLRFVYQWLYSRRRHESLLPAGFWIISLVGSLTIIAYAIIRLDPVLIVGQAFGVVAYARNLWLALHTHNS